MDDNSDMLADIFEKGVIAANNYAKNLESRLDCLILIAREF